MPSSERFAAVLFWFMLATGFAMLAPCLVLPAWFDYRDARHIFIERTQSLAELRAQRRTAGRQIEHLKHDHAYLERLAARELGIETGDRRTILLDEKLWAAGDRETKTAAGRETKTTAPPAVPDHFAALSAAVDVGIQRAPSLIYTFVSPHTRPVVMIAACVMIFAAVFLVRPRKPRVAAPVQHSDMAESTIETPVGA